MPSIIRPSLVVAASLAIAAPSACSSSGEGAAADGASAGSEGGSAGGEGASSAGAGGTNGGGTSAGGGSGGSSGGAAGASTGSAGQSGNSGVAGFSWQTGLSGFGGEAGFSGGSGGIVGSSGAAGQTGVSGSGGGKATVTCKQAGGNRCATAASECAGLTTVDSSDCVACCLVPDEPVYGKSFPDPFVVRVGGTYHAFATGKLIPHMTSTDLVTWKADPNGSLNPGPWADQTTDHWAPTVYQAKNGTWVMFYAGLVAGTGKHCLGRATSSAIGQTFVDSSQTPFVCKSAGGWSLDPSVFRDASTGKDYLLWRQDTSAMPHGTIHISELDDTGHLTGNEHEILQRASTQPSWEFDSSGGVMENPAMIRAGGTYHLFYSGYMWQTAKYANGHAVCDAPFGPCTKTSVAKPWQGNLGKMLGPGGADFVKAADGTTFMYMHGWESPDVGPGVGVRKLWFYRFVAKSGQEPAIAPL